jgi:FkbM family methyltransferase
MTNKYSNEYLMQKLSSALKKNSESRYRRLFTNPYKTIFNKLIILFAGSSEVKTKTFWKQNMSIVLPEHVSWNIWHYGYFEYDVCMMMLMKLCMGMTMIDIGAHFGFFSLLASHLVGKSGLVLAIEPTPDSFDLLLKNVLNHKNVITLNCAAYDRDMDMKFLDYGLCKSAFNSIIGTRSAGDHCEKHKEIIVKTKTIDKIINENNINKIDFIKIDAESSEMHVLQGMCNTLKVFKPAIVLEVGDFDFPNIPKSIELIKYLCDFDYEPYEVQNSKLVPHVIKNIYKYGNILFLKK